MAVNLAPPGELLAVSGVKLATGAAAIKSPGRDDVTLLLFEPGTSVAGVFTRSAFRAAPVLVAEERIRAGEIRALLINSGNANACTGEKGLQDAKYCADLVAEALDIAPEFVAVASTGVIGEPLPVARISAALPSLMQALSPHGFGDLAEAISVAPSTASEAVVAACTAVGVIIQDNSSR